MTGTETMLLTSQSCFIVDPFLFYKGLAKLANIACQTLLFVSVSLAMDNQRTLLFGREQ